MINKSVSEMNQIEIGYKYGRLVNSVRKAQEKLDKFLEEIKPICEHPDSICQHYNIDADDGYGTWWIIYKKRCICGQEFVKHGSDWVKCRE